MRGGTRKGEEMKGWLHPGSDTLGKILNLNERANEGGCEKNSF